MIMTEEWIDALPLDLDAILNGLLDRIGGLLPCDSGGVLLNDPDEAHFSLVAYRGAGTPPDSVAPDEGIVGAVSAARVALIVSDMQTDARCRFIDPGSRAELAAPVLFEGRVLAVLNVESHQPDAYTPEHARLLNTLAEDNALVIYLIDQYTRLSRSHFDLSRRIQVHRRESSTLQRLVTITSAALDIDEMLAHALREAVTLLGCDGAQLWLPNHLAYQLEIHAASRIEQMAAISAAPLPLNGPGMLVEAYHTGKSRHSTDPTPSPNRTSLNVLACPLNTHNRTLGVLHLYHYGDPPFSESDTQIASTVADQIAVSMSSMQMLAAERYRLNLLNQVNHVSQELSATLDPQELLRQAAARIHDIFGQYAVHIYLFEPDDNTVRLSAAAGGVTTVQQAQYDAAQDILPIEEGVIWRALRHGETQNVGDLREDPDCPPQNDHHRLQSCLTVPLRRGERVVGAISVLSTQLNAFSGLERDALETLATQASTALHNAQLYTQAQRRLLEQGIVYQIGQGLTSILHYRELSEMMAQHLNRALNTSACMVALYESDTNTVRIEADYRAPHHHDANGQRIMGQPLPLDEHYALALALRTREPVTIYRADDALDVPPQARALLESLGDHSQLVMPMVAADRVIGAVDWTDNQPGRRFSQDDLRLARTLITQATIAIENALLFRQLEERAHDLAEANRLRSQFLATISHELRTPMNSIIGFSETLLDGLYGQLTEMQASRLERIQRNGYSLLALIDDLLDLSRIDAGRMKLHLETLQLTHAIATAAQNFEMESRKKNLTLRLDLPDDLPRVLADPERLHQIITNLLSNAVKFTHEGEIAIRACEVVIDSRSFIKTSVTDTGIGISDADQAIIFDEFRQVDGSSTRAYGGTGLGLAISRRLVEMMGGTIDVESTPNQGSSFSFTLPVTRAERETAL